LSCCTCLVCWLFCLTGNQSLNGHRLGKYFHFLHSQVDSSYGHCSLHHTLSYLTFWTFVYSMAAQPLPTPRHGTDLLTLLFFTWAKSPKEPVATSGYSWILSLLPGSTFQPRCCRKQFSPSPSGAGKWPSSVGGSPAEVRWDP
jgi:hypothetical protein